MNGDSTSNPERSGSAVGIILTIVCTLSGVFSCIQVAKFFPVWLAVLITIIVGLLLVGSLVTSLGNDLLDVAIGCVVVIVVMAVVLPVGAKAFRRHFPVTGRVSSRGGLTTDHRSHRRLRQSVRIRG